MAGEDVAREVSLERRELHTAGAIASQNELDNAIAEAAEAVIEENEHS